MTAGEHPGGGETKVELPARLHLASVPPMDHRVAELKARFPEAVREGRVDLDSLSRSIGEWVDPGQERFGLIWPGKAECMRVIQQPSVGTLLPMPDESISFDTTQNLIIEGDNLEVLKLLQKSYYGEIKLIYIDPPYNTGHEFVYPDNYREGLQGYLRYSNQADTDGYKLNANTETDGRYHSTWLTMMYPRLYLARNLMRDDGMLFVSIDDHEVHHLRLVLNEIFGEENFLGNIVRATGTTTGQDARGFGSSFDYLLCYSKNAGFEMGGIPLSSKDEARFDLQDSRGRYSLLQLRKTGNNDRREDRPLMYFAVEAPDGTKVFPIGPTGYESCWRCGPSTYRKLAEDDFIVWKKVLRDGVERWAPYQKYYLEGRTKRPSPLWNDIDGNKKATLEVKELLGEKIFSNPKPTALVNRILDLGTDIDVGDIVLDFFAGSGTVGHAVMEKNAADGGNRQFILVQLPEPTDNKGFPTISAITRQRVRKVSERLSRGQSTIVGTPDVGFRAFKLDESGFAVWPGDNRGGDEIAARLSLLANNVRSGRSQHDLLTELMLKAGYPLTAKVEERILAGKLVFSVDDDALLICLEVGLTIDLFEALADLNPGLIVVLDAGFGNNDELKVNAVQTVRSRRSASHASTELKVV